MKGAMAQALSYAVCKEMPYQADGQPLVRDLNDYHIFAAAEMPELVMRFVETVEPSHPFDVKVVGEIGIFGIAGAVMNAIHRQHPAESK